MAQPKQSYIALPDQDSLDSQSDVESNDENDTKLVQHRKFLNPSSFIFIMLLFIIIIVQSIFLIRNQAELKRKNALTSERFLERKIYAPNKYVSENETEAALAWDSIRPGHGFVAVEPQYAIDNNLPPTMPLPGDSTKLVYAIESYHAIHCVRIIRDHYLALKNGAYWDWSWEHDMHCLDSLRQYVMCNPDETLLYTFGRRDVGHGQVKMCKDWDRIRDWAQERSACYFDSEPDSGIQRWGNCQIGDGLPVGSLL